VLKKLVKKIMVPHYYYYLFSTLYIYIYIYMFLSSIDFGMILV